MRENKKNLMNFVRTILLISGIIFVFSLLPFKKDLLVLLGFILIVSVTSGFIILGILKKHYDELLEYKKNTSKIIVFCITIFISTLILIATSFYTITHLNNTFGGAMFVLLNLIAYILFSFLIISIDIFTIPLNVIKTKKKKIFIIFTNVGLILISISLIFIAQSMIKSIHTLDLYTIIFSGFLTILGSAFLVTGAYINNRGKEKKKLIE
jgi:hypothetical protein